MRVRVAEYLSYFTNGNIILRIGHNRITALPSPFIAESFLLPNKKIATTQLYCWVKKITVQKIAYSSNVQHDTLRCRCGIPNETKRNRSPFGTELNSEMVLIETKMIVFYLHIEARRQLQFSLYEDNWVMQPSKTSAPTEFYLLETVLWRKKFFYRAKSTSLPLLI